MRPLFLTICFVLLLAALASTANAERIIIRGNGWAISIDSRSSHQDRYDRCGYVTLAPRRTRVCPRYEPRRSSSWQSCSYSSRYRNNCKSAREIELERRIEYLLSRQRYYSDKAAEVRAAYRAGYLRCSTYAYRRDRYADLQQQYGREISLARAQLRIAKNTRLGYYR